MNDLIRFKHVVSELVELSPTVWINFESKLYFKKINKDEYFSKENSITKEIAFITKGLLRIFYLDNQGQEWNKKFLTPDDFVMASLSPNEQSKVFIQSIQDTELMAIQYVDFVALTKKYPMVMELAQKLITRYLSLKEDREISLLSINAKERYLQFLEEFSDIKDDIPQYHISSYLGITPTQLSRLKKEISTNQHL